MKRDDKTVPLLAADICIMFDCALFPIHCVITKEDLISLLTQTIFQTHPFLFGITPLSQTARPSSPTLGLNKQKHKQFVILLCW